MVDTRRPAGRKAGKPESQWDGRLAAMRAGRPESLQVGETDRPRKQVIRHHWELEVHQLAVEVAMQIFELSRKWPPEEKFSLTDQARRASRSVATQILGKLTKMGNNPGPWLLNRTSPKPSD